MCVCVYECVSVHVSLPSRKTSQSDSDKIKPIAQILLYHCQSTPQEFTRQRVSKDILTVKINKRISVIVFTIDGNNIVKFFNKDIENSYFQCKQWNRDLSLPTTYL